MTEREQAAHIKSEANRLNASPLLLAMVHIIFQVNGYEAALKCLTEGVEQGI